MSGAAVRDLAGASTMTAFPSRPWWRLCVALWAVAAAGAAAAMPPATLEAPSGGWNRGTLTDHSGDGAVAYPNPPIDRGVQAGRTLIRGRLAAEHRARDANRRPRTPPTLVVNGNPMPLYSDADGHFARPYAFGPGSNSVEIRSADGQPLRRLQFFEADPGRPRAQLRAILAWDDDQAEVDLHVLTPDGQHAFWAHPVLANGGGMDVDSVDGAGPEMFSMTAPLRGPYQLYVNYWGNFGDAGYHFDESTRQKKIITCRITLVFHENTPQERRESFVVPLRKIGDLTHVKTVMF